MLVFVYGCVTASKHPVSARTHSEPGWWSCWSTSWMCSFVTWFWGFRTIGWIISGSRVSARRNRPPSLKRPVSLSYSGARDLELHKGGYPITGLNSGMNLYLLGSELTEIWRYGAGNYHDYNNGCSFNSTWVGLSLCAGCQWPHVWLLRQENWSRSPLVRAC